MRNNQYNGWNYEGLQRLLDASGITWNDLAKVIGVSVASVRHYLHGESVPEAENLVKIADYFAVPCDFLLGRTGIEEGKRILENYGEKFMELRRAPYEAYLIGRRKFKESFDRGTYESPWPYNLLEATFNSPAFPIEEEWIDVLTPDQYDGLMEAVDTIPERKKEVIIEYFQKGKRLIDIGEEMGLSRERVRQIIQSGLRRLRAPVNVKLIRYGSIGARRASELEKKLEVLQIAEKEVEKRRQETRKEIEEILGKKADEDEQQFQRVRLTDMDLTRRSENILYRMGARTLLDVMRIVEKGKLEKTRGIGKISLEEILVKVKVMSGKDFSDLYSVTLKKYGVSV